MTRNQSKCWTLISFQHINNGSFVFNDTFILLHIFSFSLWILGKNNKPSLLALAGKVH